MTGRPRYLTMIRPATKNSRVPGRLMERRFIAMPRAGSREPMTCRMRSGVPVSMPMRPATASPPSLAAMVAGITHRQNMRICGGTTCRKQMRSRSASSAALSAMWTNVTSRVMWVTQIMVPRRPSGRAMVMAAVVSTPEIMAQAVPTVPARPGSAGAVPPAEMKAT